VLAETEILIQPYSSKQGLSLLDILIRELQCGKWSRFQAAVAFIKQSGNFPELVEAIHQFVGCGGTVEITFGADVFGGAQGSDYEAVRLLLSEYHGSPNVRLFLYHEKGRTFHPKTYLFSDEHETRALVIVGSSNWSDGGLVANVETNVLIWLDLSAEDHRRCYESLVHHFVAFWREGA
jgi:HKD family nuclease